MQVIEQYDVSTIEGRREVVAAMRDVARLHGSTLSSSEDARTGGVSVRIKTAGSMTATVNVGSDGGPYEIVWEIHKDSHARLVMGFEGRATDGMGACQIARSVELLMSKLSASLLAVQEGQAFQVECEKRRREKAVARFKESRQRALGYKMVVLG